jgi:phage gp29-like protein
MKPQGLYISPTEFVRFAEPRQRLSEHIATRDRSPDFFALGMYLPNPDPILKKQGRDISIYSDLRSDAHVGGCIRRRKAAVLGLEWRVERDKASARMTRLCEEVLGRLDMRRLLHEILEATLYGWQPLEVLWSTPGAGPNVPLQVLAKPVHWFHFDGDGQLRFRCREQPLYGELQPPRKFLVPAQEASYANPYGFADLSMCFWPTVFKRGGLKFWVTFTEKFGTPWVVAKTPRGTPGPEQDKLLDQLEAMVQDAVAVIPDDASVDIKGATNKGSSADLYERLLMFCRSEIAIALLGQNQSTESNSNKASATAGLEVGKDIRDGDARLCEAAINELLRWVVQANEGDGAPAPKFELFEQMEVDEVQAKRDKLLFDAGLRFTPAYWQRVYDLEDGDIAPPEVPPTGTALPGSSATGGAAGFHTELKQAVAAAPAAFAEGARTPATTPAAAPRTSPTAALYGALATAGDGVLQQWMTQVADLVQAAASPEALRDDLLAAYGSLPTEQLTQVMALAFAVAELSGMDAVQSEQPPAAQFVEGVPVAASQAQPQVITLQPIIHNHITVPEQAAPVLNFAAAPAAAVQAPPQFQIDVHVPAQAAPVVHVAAPAVTVQPAPVTVNNAFASKAVQSVERDADGEIARTVTTYE